MALSRDEFERIQRLQRQLDARSRLETERALFRLLQRYDRLVDELRPLREEVLRQLESGDLDGAEAAIERMQELAARRLQAIERSELADIRAVMEQAALRGAQVVDLAPAVAAMPNAGLSEILAALEQVAAADSGAGGGTVGVGYGRITRVAVEAIERKVYQDGLNLSRRLHTRLEERRREFERLLVDGLTEGRGAIQLARQIERLDITDPQLPRYLRDLERTLKGTRDAGLADEIRRAAAEAAKRKKGPLGIGGVSRRVVKAARSGSAEKLDRAIGEFLQRKVRYHAIVIARTEAAEAFREAHVRKAQESPWVRGVAWRLSNSHARTDVCDQLASQDRHGLGPGVYPPEHVPEIPHPQDMCYRTDVVDLDYFTEDVRRRVRAELQAQRRDPERDRIESEIDRLLENAPLEDRVRLLRHLLDRAGLSHIESHVESMHDRGYTAWDRGAFRATGTMNFVKVALQRDDPRPQRHQIKTAFHEFVHTLGNGQVSDSERGGARVLRKIPHEAWLRIEETVVETTAHYLARRAGITGEIAPAYSRFLADVLPRLKRVQGLGFEEVQTIADFGQVFAQSRFGLERNIAWGNVSRAIDEITFDVREYSEQYREYVFDNLDSIVEAIADNFGETGDAAKSRIRQSIVRGWQTRSLSYPGFSDSLIIAMNRLGVR